MNTGSARSNAFKPLKILRWAIAAGLVIVIGLMIHTPAKIAEPLPAATAKQKNDEFQAKFDQLEQAHARGERAEQRFTAEELNAAFQTSQIATAPTQTAATPDPSVASPEPAPGITTTEIAFVDDHATGQFVVHSLGKDFYLTVSGRIGVAEGYATFVFTQAKIGDMPVPVSLLNPRLQATLQEPETRQKLKLPEYVADLRVENGQLVVVEK